MKKRVLFLCSHNSARSQMAEGFLRALAGDRFEVGSAGTRATQVHPLAIVAMRELGIDISSQRSKNLDEVGEGWDVVVTVCDSHCPVPPRSGMKLSWRFPDPSAATGTDAKRLALPLLILDLTHSIAAAAALRVVQSIPYILFGAPAGALIDRADKRRLLIICDAASAALTITIPLSAILGFFSIEFLFVIGFLLGTVEVLWGVTTDFSVVPALVHEDELTEANSIFFAADRGARVIGPTVGGLAIAAFGGLSAM